MDQTLNMEENDQVRMLTSPQINARIDSKIQENIARYAGASPEEIERRIQELDQEWDIDRALMATAGGFSLLGVALAGITRSRKWLLLPTSIGGFLVQHAYQGSCAPMSLLRRAGVRTRSEIEREKSALQQLMSEARGSIDPDDDYIESEMQDSDLPSGVSEESQPSPQPPGITH